MWYIIYNIIISCKLSNSKYKLKANISNNLDFMGYMIY